VQDLVFSDVNRDTADVLLANGFARLSTPPGQGCLRLAPTPTNGEYEMAKDFAKAAARPVRISTKTDRSSPTRPDCGSHLKHFDALLEDDPLYAARAGSGRRGEGHQRVLGRDRLSRAGKSGDPRPCGPITMPAISATDRRSPPQPRELLAKNSPGW